MAKALTAAAIEKFKPAAKRREIPDAHMPGLYLILQPSGARAWAVRYRVNGRPAKYTIGPYPAFSLAAARKAAAEARQQAAQGGDPAAVKVERRRAEASQENDFGTVLRRWIEREQRPNNRSWQETARLLGVIPDPREPTKLVAVKGRLADKWETRKIGEIRRADIIGLMDTIRDRGTPYIANRTLAHLKSMFNWAISRDMLTANPCLGVKPQPETSRERVLSDDELRRVWQAAGDLDWRFGTIVKLLILTGQRREEVSGIMWTEIDLDKALWTIPRGRTKTDTGHTVPLSAPAVDILSGVRSMKGSLVFTTTGTTPVSGFSRAKDKLDTLSGVTDWRIHDLRRSVATGLQRLGVRLEVTEAVLGHTSGSRAGVVGVYQRHEYATEKRGALDQWACHVMSLVEPGNVIELAKARAS